MLADLIRLVAPPPRARPVARADAAEPAVLRLGARLSSASDGGAAPLDPSHNLQRTRERRGLDVRVHRGELVDVRDARAAAVLALAHVRDDVQRGALVKNARRVHEPRVRRLVRRVMPFGNLSRVHRHHGIDREARPGVDLEQVRVEVFVQDDVEAKDLEARLG